MALRYLRTPPGLPSRCDGCGESFTLQHGLDCLKSGCIIRRQNKIRDCLGNLAALFWPQHIREPMVREGDPASDDPGLRRNLEIWGVWQPQAKMLFDIHVIGTDTSSYSGVHLFPFLRVRLLRKSLPFSCGGQKRKFYTLQFIVCCIVRLCTLSNVYLPTWFLSRRNLSDVLTFVCSRLLFASVHSASMCLRGSRIKWRSSLGFDDGAPLQFVIQLLNT